MTQVDGGGHLSVKVAAEGAVLADLEAEAELGDALEPEDVDVEGNIVADGATCGIILLLWQSIGPAAATARPRGGRDDRSGGRWVEGVGVGSALCEMLDAAV